MNRGALSARLDAMAKSGELAAMIAAKAKPRPVVVDVRGRVFGTKLPLLVRTWKPEVKAESSPEPVDPRGRHAVTMDAILREVASAFGVTIADIKGRRVFKYLIRPRHASMHLAHEMTEFSLPMIGRLIGGRDHTTVLNGLRRAEHLIATDEAFARHVQAARERVQHG